MSNPTMADLMASTFAHPKTLTRGEEVEGEITGITVFDIILDLGTKAEGVMSKKDLKPRQTETLQVGDKIKAFVLIPENSSGQTILTPFKSNVQAGSGGKSREQTKRWQKFITAIDRQSHVKGQVVEVNRGGLLVEVEGVRGFVPSSQLDLSSLKNLSDLTDLIGKELTLSVLEVDPGSNRLIFSARKTVDEKVKDGLRGFNVGDKVSGVVAAVMPFGIFVELSLTSVSAAVEGLIFPQEVAWETLEDLSSRFKVGQEIEAKVIGKDESLGRVSLSLRQLEEDPFEKISENFQPDDVVSGTITEITHNGVSARLRIPGVEGSKDQVLGIITADKLTLDNSYQVGQTANFLVDSIDMRNRRVNLAPFLTSTKGLIYK